MTKRNITRRTALRIIGLGTALITGALTAAAIPALAGNAPDPPRITGYAALLRGETSSVWLGLGEDEKLYLSENGGPWRQVASGEGAAGVWAFALTTDHHLKELKP